MLAASGGSTSIANRLRRAGPSSAAAGLLREQAGGDTTRCIGDQDQGGTCIVIGVQGLPRSIL